MRSLLMCLGMVALSMPVFAADKPATGGPFEGGNIMSAREKSDCKLAIRLAARLQRIKGQISREQMQTVLQATDNKEAYGVIVDHVQDMVVEQAYSSGKAVGFKGPGGILQWILDNWPAIMQMIMQIIGLFSQDTPPADLGSIADDILADGTMFVSWGGCASGACAVPERAPAEPATAACATERSILSGPILVEGQPARNVGRVTVYAGRRVLRGTARVATAPFRLLFRGCGSN